MARWSPTLEQVKALIPSRVNEGPFTETSTPTRTQVQVQIDGIEAELEAEVGPIPAVDSIEKIANWTAALGVAAAVEDAFFPEQQEDNGPAQRLGQRYADQKKRLLTVVENHGQDASRRTVGTIKMTSATVAGYRGGCSPVDRFADRNCW